MSCRKSGKGECSASCRLEVEVTPTSKLGRFACQNCLGASESLASDKQCDQPCLLRSVHP